MINSNDGGGNYFGERRGDLDRTKIIPPRSSITSQPPSTFPIMCAERSRIIRPSASPARRPDAAEVRQRRQYGPPRVFAGRRRKRLHRARSEEREHLICGQPGRAAQRYDRKTGHMRDVQVYPLFFSGMSSAVLKERWQWTFPIVFNPDRSENSVHVLAASVEDHQ